MYLRNIIKGDIALAVHNVDDLQEREVLPGCFARILHSEKMTVVFWRLNPATTVPQHSHSAEQITHLVEGEMALTVGSDVHNLTSGGIIRIASDVPHSVVTTTECRIVDFFAPARNDLEGLLL